MLDQVNIVNNIKHLRKKSGLTQEQFANEIGIKRSSVGAYEEGRAEPQIQTLSKMAEVLSVTVDELINEDLTTEKAKSTKSSKEKLKILSITVDENDRENIELVPQKAAAGYLNGFSDPEYIAELPKFKLPNLPSNATYRAFELSGDSMLPLVPGTIIIGKYVESIRDVKNGKTYVLITQKEGIVYKRVFNYLDEQGKLYLVSDNKSYSAYQVDPIDVEEIWEAVAFISIQFPDPETANDLTLEKLTGIVLTLQNDVNTLKKSLPDNE
jgi:transcriptional regulator with XRE-family HTH domain